MTVSANVPPCHQTHTQKGPHWMSVLQSSKSQGKSAQFDFCIAFCQLTAKKCDEQRPVCTPCVKHFMDVERCEYDYESPKGVTSIPSERASDRRLPTAVSSHLDPFAASYQPVLIADEHLFSTDCLLSFCKLQRTAGYRSITNE